MVLIIYPPLFVDMLKTIVICLCLVPINAQLSEIEISDALATLNAYGIQGLDGLCHQGPNELFTIPSCHGDPGSSSQNLRRRRIHGTLVTDTNDNAGEEERNATFYFVNIGGATISILLVALIAAMFLGFLTLDPLDIRVKMRAAIDPVEKEAAAEVFELVNQSHRLLVTLLLMNALAYECLPLFLDNLMPTYMTILFSVSLLLIFGEIIPSAIFTGPDQLILASKLAPLVAFSLKALYPITYPLIKLLDWLVPSDSDEEEYNRAELSALVRIQYDDRMKSQRQQEAAMSEANSTGGVSSPLGKMPRSRVRHMANQINAEKQRHRQLAEHDNFNSARSWRNFKEEIMHAAAEKSQAPPEPGILDGLISGMENVVEGNSDDMGGKHRRTPSSSSMSSTPLPIEQIAPPMERSEIKAVEGALKLKTGCAFDV